MGGYWSESRRAEREAQPRLFGVLAWTYPYSSPPSTSDSSSSEKKHDVSDDKDLVESPDDLMVKRRPESPDSGVSVKSDGSKAEPIDFKEGVSPRPDTSSSEEEDVADDEDLVKSSDVVMATQNQESNDSGVSLKSDRSE